MGVQSALDVAAASAAASVGKMVDRGLQPKAKKLPEPLRVVRFVSVGDLARLVGFSVRTVKRDCQRGLLPEPVIKNNRWYFTEPEAEAYVEKVMSRRGRGRITVRSAVTPEECEV